MTLPENLSGHAFPVHFLHPGSLDTRTGGYIYDRRVVDGLRGRGRDVRTIRLAESFPHPAPAELAEAAQAMAEIPDGAVTIVDGLAFGAMPDIAMNEAGRLSLVALVHHPLCDETGTDPVAADALYRSERRALLAARHIVCTSPATAARLADFDVEASRISVVEPGVDQADPAPADRPDGVFRLMTVGTLIRRKGYDVLIDALARLKDLPWQLSIVGSPDRDPGTAAMIRAKLAGSGLAGRVRLAGELDTAGLEAVWAECDLFVFASHYEGYGMVIAEAVARGLPIVSTRAGAVADTAPAEASMLVPVGDAQALADAIGLVLSDDAVYRRLRAGALGAREGLRGWDEVASEMITVTDRAAAAPAPRDDVSKLGGAGR